VKVAPEKCPGWIRAAGLAAVIGFLLLFARYFHPVYGFTSLLQLDASNDEWKIPEFRELPIYVHRETGGYDGLYYAQIAYHPALDAPELHTAIDNLSYRARRMLPSTLAWLLAGGRKTWIAQVYSVLNLAAWLGMAALLWRLLSVRDARGWLAWAGFMFSAGALISVRLALTDLMAAGFIAAAMAATERGRPAGATASLAASCLTRETAVLAVVGAWTPPWVSRRNSVVTLGAWVPLGLWLLYVLWRVGPGNPGIANLTLPVMGFVEKWIEAIYAVGLHPDRLLTGSTLLCTLGLTVQAAYLIKHRDPANGWWRLGAAYTLLMFCLGRAVWEDFPGAATRVLLPLTLAFNVLAHRARAALIWLVVGNFTVVAGLVALRDPPANPRELAALRSQGVAGIAEIGGGWYGREADSRHEWLWTARRGLIRIDAWPRGDTTLALRFEMRALTPRTVVVRQQGRELARYEIGTTRSAHTLPVRIEAGRTEIEFITLTPPTPEAPHPGARELGFALYDLRLALPGS
jgi:hypothetical protein